MADAPLVRQPGTLIRKRKDGTLEVPDNPTIAYVEGDGTGRDIWKASVRVIDAAVAKAYAGRRKIGWHEASPHKSRCARISALPQAPGDLMLLANEQIENDQEAVS